MTDTQTSPLAEASTTSLDEFFSRKPPFDSATRTAIITEFRRMRAKWADGTGAPAKSSVKRTPVKKPAAQLDAGDLWSETPPDEAPK